MDYHVHRPSQLGPWVIITESWYKAALAHGATIEEIMEVLKLCVIQGIEAANMALPIFAEELTRAAVGDPPAANGD